MYNKTKFIVLYNNNLIYFASKSFDLPVITALLESHLLHLNSPPVSLVKPKKPLWTLP